ncbi:anti-sigma70 protein [Aeromonas phage AS-yj]|uniref:Anti-sigma70 protein n=6 Tax=Caudoviricetes TaxID=2731619 RepID=A0A291LE78_9CAUD|nr:anti-sigma factor [Aeromonas phage AS-zj]YP_009834845.1 anti-sigma factor [Aeromonas phage AS-sw]ATI17353.1 anti-sigma70 protein [Aeromonas phage AS-szw]ATI17741.1 anti-sigma70 protein [Aeromonas phage AS-yj]QAX97798.1 anti-sigma70 protein [Aeromonas phage Asswx_1]QAX99148.1 anti-sigma70 protein [Aeromonas phage Assk]UKM62832.1 putative anti-sigma 70 protein [Aeromonas phage P19]
MKITKVELMKDIVATASILAKYGCDDILDTQSGFVDFLNELGFTTVRGKPLTIFNFRVMVSSLTPYQKKEIIKEFDAGRIDHLINCMVDE